MYTICRPLKGQRVVLQRVLAEMHRGLRLASDINADTLPKQTAHFAIRNYCGSVYTPWLPCEMEHARQPVAVTVNGLPNFTFPSESTVDLWTHKTKSCTPSPPPVQATVNDQKLMEPGRCGRQTPKSGGGRMAKALCAPEGPAQPSVVGGLALPRRACGARWPLLLGEGDTSGLSGGGGGLGCAPDRHLLAVGPKTRGGGGACGNGSPGVACSGPGPDMQLASRRETASQ